MRITDAAFQKQGTYSGRAAHSIEEVRKSTATFQISLSIFRYREKLKLEKRRTELHPNRCPRCGQLLPVTGNDLQGSDREPAEPGLETDES